MKKRCKERIWKLVIAAVLLALIFIPVIAARGVELSVKAPKEVGEGSTFEVSIAVEKIKNLNSGKFDLSFDSSVINVTDVADGSLDGTIIPAEMWIADEGIINVIVDIPGISGVSGSGNLATVSFEVVGEKRDRTELVISNVQLVDDEAEFIEVGKLVGAEIKVVDVKEVVEEKEEKEEEEQQPPGITPLEPLETEVNSIEGESVTFEIEVDQKADISWQINGTEVQKDEDVTGAIYTNTSVAAGTWNLSAIATNTETGLSSMHTWTWSVTPASAESSEGTPTPTPTLTPGVTQTPTPKATSSSGQTVKSTPTVKPMSTPKSEGTTPTTTPTPETPGFEAVFAIAAMSAIAYALGRRRRERR